MHANPMVVLVAVCVFTLVGCAEAPTRAEPDSAGSGGSPYTFGAVQVEAGGMALLGYVPYDSLPPAMRAKAAQLGYKGGDQIPARREKRGTLYFLKPPSRNLNTTNAADWVRQ